MAKAVEVLKRLVQLCNSGKIKDAAMHDVLNGAIVNGKFVYKSGSLYNPETQRLVTLSLDKVTSFVWPKKKDVKAEADVKHPETKKSDVTSKQHPESFWKPKSRSPEVPSDSDGQN